ncbi:hypothetical protein FACS1894172_11640 [Spirochaetia bacterium]|nr:hypothetical protein FACS1894164_19370 [Spirochaetia bacterium]GHU33334.1 hypothetical protein FACS1894172_11640 [Spirochaetia bacterium]
MAETFDYKKEYKDLYFPKNQPVIIEVPEIAFVAVEGKRNPNDEDGEYQKAVEILYGISYTIKMSKKGNNIPNGYFDYVVPPLEGLCVQCMHIGSYDEEPKTIKSMEKYIEENNLVIDINEKRKHHEIYLSDPRKTEKLKIKTILRIPVKKYK